MENFDLGWYKDCYVIAKVTFDKEIMKIEKEIKQKLKGEEE